MRSLFLKQKFDKEKWKMKFKKIVGMLGGLAMSVAVLITSMPLPVLADSVKQEEEAEFDDVSQNIYSAIVSKAKAISNVTENTSTSTSTVISIPLEDIGIPTEKKFAASDFGVETITEDTFNDYNFYINYLSYFGIDSDYICNALSSDLDLYWWNKQIFIDLVTPLEATEDGTKVYFNDDAEMKVYLYVDKEYSSNDEGTEVDSSKVQAAQTAINYANEIVSDAEEICQSDKEKLKYYAQQICKMNTYNIEAATQGDAYGTMSPWQLIYVFDNNDDTNVLCEGYSKAFQLLCELTTFDDKNLRCYSVAGKFEGGNISGEHMWNIISSSDGNYIFDVTNCDVDKDGSFDDDFFMVRPISGSVNTGYNLANGCHYEYFEHTKKLFDSSVLELELTDAQDSSNNGEDNNVSDDSGETTLGKGSQKIYEIIMDKADRIKAGEISSRNIEIPFSDLGYDGDAMTWAPEDFGYDVFLEDDASDIAVMAFYEALEKLDIDLNDVLMALRTELDLYWWDTSYLPDIYGVTMGEDFISITGISLSMPVSVTYRLDGDEYWVDPNCDALKVVELAKANAKKIVEAAKSYDDIEKLRYYSEQICNSNTYDREYWNKVIADETDLDTNSSQYVYVLDDNDKTNVVCEGYSKALKLLCDMTDFDNKTIKCYTVCGETHLLDDNGDIGDLEGGHMWNIVSINGNNYIIDLTNSDNNDHSDSQFNGNIFLNVPDKGDVETGYSYYNIQIGYVYYQTMVKIYGNDILALSYSDYVKPSQQTTEDSPSEDSSSDEETESTPASTVVSNEPIVEDSKGWDSFDEKLEKAVAKGIVNVDLNGTDTIPAKVIRTIAEKNVTMAVKVDKNTLVTIDGSKITPAEASEIKLISIKNADGSELVGVRSQNADIEKSIVIFRNMGLENVGSSAVLYFENADKSLLEFRTSPVYENGFAAFEVPFVNANYKVALR
jgi:hypothetical protein